MCIAWCSILCCFYNTSVASRHVARIFSSRGPHAQGTPTKNRKLLRFSPLFFGSGPIYYFLFYCKIVFYFFAHGGGSMAHLLPPLGYVPGGVTFIMPGIKKTSKRWAWSRSNSVRNLLGPATSTAGIFTHRTLTPVRRLSKHDGSMSLNATLVMRLGCIDPIFTQLQITNWFWTLTNSFENCQQHRWFCWMPNG